MHLNKHQVLQDIAGVMERGGAIVILDSEEEGEEYEQQRHMEQGSDPLLMAKARVIYLQHSIRELQGENQRLKRELDEMRVNMERKQSEEQFRELRSQIEVISSAISNAEFSRRSEQTKMEEQKEQLKAELQTYKQKYSQAVSANLRKTKTLDKNEQIATKLEQQLKNLKAQTTRQAETASELKTKMGRLQTQKTQTEQQNIKHGKQIESLHNKLSRQEQSHSQKTLEFQDKIVEQQTLIQQMADNIQNMEEQAWRIKRQNSSLQHSNQDLCVICYERSAILLNESCGHLLSCLECSSQLDSCPICRTVKSRFIRLWRT